MASLEKKEFAEIKSLADLRPDYFHGNQGIDRIRFRGLIFDAFRFKDCAIKSSEFIECAFNGCVFDTMDLQRVAFIDCTLENCAFGPEYRFITGSFQRCKLSECDFGGAFVQNIKWMKCEMTGVDFQKLKAKSVSFPETQMYRVKFDWADITRGDFRTVPNLQRDMFYSVKLDDCQFDWNEVFVIMEFEDRRRDELYQYGIEPVVKELGIEPKRVDRYEFRGKITDEILQNIVTSKLVIAECSAPNKNVFFEIGYSLGRHKDVVFCVDKEENIPFDLKDQKFIIHEDSIDKLKEKLTSRVKFLLRLK